MKQDMQPSLKKRAIRRRRQQGLTLIESAVALGIVAIMLATFGQMTAQNQQAIKSRAAALQLQQVTSAAGQYIQANYGQVLTHTPLGTVSYIPTGQAVPNGTQPTGTGGMQSLQAAGFLSQAYVDANPYGQQTALLVTQPATAPGRLEAMVVTHKGQQIADDELGRIATSVGASGGFIPKTPPAGSGIQPNTIVGSYGGWRSTAANWANSQGVTPTSGHLMSTLAFQNGALLQDFLYRHDIGNPDANSMSTDIHMLGNSLNGVGTICGGTAQLGCANMTIDMNNDSISNLGTINAAGNALNVNGSLTASGDVTSGGNLKANSGYLQVGSLPPDADNPGYAPAAGGGYFSNDVKIGGSQLVNGDTTVQGDGFFKQSLSVDSDVVAGGKLVGKERVLAPKMTDSDNEIFQVDPASLSSFAMLNPTMLNADAYVFGASVNRPVNAQDPRTLTLSSGMTEDQKLAAVDAAQSAFYNEAKSKYDPTGANATQKMPLRLGDLLPKFVLQQVYLLTPTGVTYNTVDPATGNPTVMTSPVADPNNPIATIPYPACGSGVPEMYLSRVDESESFNLPVTTSAGIVGSTGYAQGPTALYPVTAQTVQSVVTDVQTGGVNFAPNAQVTSNNGTKTWSVAMTPGGATGGEMVQGVNGASQTVGRRLMAQTFCHFGI